MPLADHVRDYLNAAFTGLWIQTSEPDEAERELQHLAQQQRWKCFGWDVARGLRCLTGSGGTAEASDPIAALRALPTLAEADGTTLLLLPHFHRYLNNPELLQTLAVELLAGKTRRTFILILAPVVQLPVELEKLFIIVDHPLPDRAQLLRIAQELTSDQPESLPKDAEREGLLAAAAGLTRLEAEGAYALSLARHGTLRPETLWELKAQALRKNHLLTLHRGTERFDSLGGLASLKKFCLKALRPGQNQHPRGVLLLGVSGTGKSAFAKALGTETGRPTLILDLGALYGSLVGATEQNIRQALKVAEAMAPCILFVDEIEKGLAGLGSQGDSGVSARLFGTLLTWLADHESEVFFIGTANDIRKLPPEFTRAERLDGVFFLDLPGPAEKASIWRQYRERFGIPATQPQPEEVHWTGAEIRACCRLAALLEVPLKEAAQQIVPVATTAAEAVEQLRHWAEGRCLAADLPGIYRRTGATNVVPKRRIKTEPTLN